MTIKDEEGNTPDLNESYKLVEEDTNNIEIKKFNEIVEINERLKKQISDMKVQYNNIDNETEQLKNQYTDNCKLLADTKYNISEIEYKIEFFKKNNNNFLNTGNLHDLCDQIISNFLIKSRPLEQSTKIIRSIKISYKETIFMKSLEDEEIDYGRMKVEFQKQFSSKDFFFTDADDNIFTDDMNVKNSLYPFGLHYSNDYIPLIKIKESRKFSRYHINTFTLLLFNNLIAYIFNYLFIVLRIKCLKKIMLVLTYKVVLRV